MPLRSQVYAAEVAPKLRATAREVTSSRRCRYRACFSPRAGRCLHRCQRLPNTPIGVRLCLDTIQVSVAKAHPPCVHINQSPLATVLAKAVRHYLRNTQYVPAPDAKLLLRIRGSIRLLSDGRDRRRYPAAQLRF